MTRPRMCASLFRWQGVRVTMHVTLLGAFLAMGASTVWAQAPATPAPDQTRSETPTEISETPAGMQPTARSGEGRVDTPSTTEIAAMPADEQLRLRETYASQMRSVEARVRELATQARTERDLIKLNCVNDKLLTVRTLLRLADGARDKLELAAASGNDRERTHQFAKITVAYERAIIAGEEAERCVGEELVYVGETRVVIDVDPTVDQADDMGFRDDPFPTDREPLASITQ